MNQSFGPNNLESTMLSTDQRARQVQGLVGQLHYRQMCYRAAHRLLTTTMSLPGSKPHVASWAAGSSGNHLAPGEHLLYCKWTNTP